MKRGIVSTIWKLTVVFVMVVLALWAIKLLVLGYYALQVFNEADAPNFEFGREMIRESLPEGVTALVLLLLILVASFAERVYLRFLAERVKTITDTMHSFASGALSSRVAPDPNPVLNKLGASFNKMAEALVAQMSDLEKVDSKRRELLINIAHDLKTPLTSVQGYVETILLKNAQLGPSEREEYLRIVMSRTRELIELINSLLELSTIESDPTVIKKESFDMPHLLQEVLEQTSSLANEKRVTFHLKNFASPTMVHGDRALLKRALANIVQNAVKYNVDGGRVVVSVDCSPKGTKITVEDTGIGIPKEALPHVFDRFYRVAKDRGRASGGSGIGLSIAKSILEAHGAKMNVESELGRGTKFEIDLPAKI